MRVPWTTNRLNPMASHDPSCQLKHELQLETKVVGVGASYDRLSNNAQERKSVLNIHGRPEAEAETPILRPPDEKNRLI